MPPQHSTKSHRGNEPPDVFAFACERRALLGTASDLTNLILSDLATLRKFRSVVHYWEAPAAAELARREKGR
jgi:hypothetical protein